MVNRMTGKADVSQMLNRMVSQMAMEEMVASNMRKHVMLTPGDPYMRHKQGEHITWLPHPNLLPPPRANLGVVGQIREQGIRVIQVIQGIQETQVEALFGEMDVAEDFLGGEDKVVHPPPGSKAHPGIVLAETPVSGAESLGIIEGIV